jgi:hypothetical protein
MLRHQLGARSLRDFVRISAATQTTSVTQERPSCDKWQTRNSPLSCIVFTISKEQIIARVSSLECRKLEAVAKTPVPIVRVNRCTDTSHSLRRGHAVRVVDTSESLFVTNPYVGEIGTLGIKFYDL